MAKRTLRHVGLRVLVLVWRVTRLSLIERVILAAIASHADEAGHAFPGESLLAAETTLGLRSVRNALRGLEGLGVLKVTRRGRQRPNEYAIQVDALESLPRVTGTNGHVTGTTDRMTGTTCRSQEGERPASDDRVTGTTLPEVTGTTCRLTAHTATAHRTDPPVVPRGDDLPGFVEFWNIYPNKVGKDAARKGWVKKRCEPIADVVIGALKAQMPYLVREGGKYIPNPATWINQGRWQDEPASRNGHDARRVNDAWKDQPVGDAGR